MFEIVQESKIKLLKLFCFQDNQEGSFYLKISYGSIFNYFYVKLKYLFNLNIIIKLWKYYNWKATCVWIRTKINLLLKLNYINKVIPA